ncbi:hypothetical protein [Nonomuraea sp. B19D2]|uniref:hypothetical protein n=1 Tax=Nonomuraea sp. B19D2 TaxID=3159561 RepID=UPI0032DA79C4
MAASTTASDVHARVTSMLENENRLFPITSPGYSKVVGRLTAANLCVDLETVYAEAQEKKATALVVFADIVRIPASFKKRLLGKDLGLLSIVARSIEIEGDSAGLILKYDKEKARQPVLRILAHEVTGTFTVRAYGTQDEKRLIAPPREEPLRYRSYTGDADGLVERQGRLAIDLLDVSSPLRQVLTASFDLAAGLMRAHVPRAEEQELARSILSWIVRWAAYPSPYLTRLFQDADTLSRLLPVTRDGHTTHSLPVLTSDLYLRLARAQYETAKKYELDRSFDGVRDDLHKVVSEVVGAWMGRDDVDLQDIDQQIDEARRLIGESTATLERVSKELANQAFDAKLSGIRLEGELAQDRIIKIAKATFEIVMGVVQIGVAISGVVGNPAAAGAVASANPATFFNTMSKFGQAAKFTGRLLPTVMILYASPYLLYRGYESGSDDDKKALQDSMKSMGPAATRILSAAQTLMKVNQPLNTVEKIGELVSQTAGVPTVIESKAVWDSFDAETGAEFEKITRDPEATKSVVDAVLAYRTTVQKYSIYQRAFCEQQALLAQQVRALGTLLIRKDGIKKKQATLAALRNDLSRKDEAVELLRSLRDARLYELRQSFFTALHRYRAAYFCEHLAWPPGMPPVAVPTDAAQMSEALAGVDQAISDVRPPVIGDFKRTLVLKKADHKELFADLVSRKEGKFALEPGEPLFAKHDLVRLSCVRVWLVGTGDSQVSVELHAGGGFQDRAPGGELWAFSGQPYAITFEYEGDKVIYDPRLEGVRPMPFTTWSLRVDAPDSALAAVSQIEFFMSGTSSARHAG